MIFHYSVKFEDDIFPDMSHHSTIEMPISNPSNIERLKPTIISRVRSHLSKKIKDWQKSPQKLTKIEIYYYLDADTPNTPDSTPDTPDTPEILLFLWSKI